MGLLKRSTTPERDATSKQDETLRTKPKELRLQLEAQLANKNSKLSAYRNEHDVVLAASNAIDPSASLAGVMSSVGHVSGTTADKAAQNWGKWK